MRVGSTASDLMSILQKKYDRGDEAASKAGGFAAILENIMRKTASPQTAASPATAPAEKDNATKYTPSHVNNTPGYKEFRDKVINDTYELSEDMFSDGEIGKYINEKGYDYIYQRRVDNAKPILPSSVAEASKGYEFGRGNIENYMRELYDKYDIQAFTSTQNNYVSFGYQSWGLVVFEDENTQSEQNFRKMRNSSEGKELTAMMEERNVYGAIASLAENNSAFAKEYDMNPESAVDKYFRELGKHMARLDNHPRIDTRKTIPYVPTVYNASRGANQIEFVPIS